MTKIEAEDKALLGEELGIYSVIMPAYNEYQNLKTLIPATVNALRAKKIKFEAVVINDGSKDETGKIIDEMAKRYKEIRALHHPKNLGKTAAMQTGFKAAKGDIVVLFETDWQYDCRDIPPMVKKLRKEGVDIVNGKRVGRADKPHRKVMSKVFNRIHYLLFKSSITDNNSGLKAFKKNVALKLYTLDPTGFYGMHRILLTLATLAGYKAVEVPVRHYARKAGKSYINPHIIVFQTLHDIIKLRIMATFLKEKLPLKSK